MAMTQQGAAIFDLDRTLIAGPSGPVFGRHLKEAGYGRRDVPGMATFYRVYEVAGENLITMQAARLAARAARGWAVDAVAEAAEGAVDELQALLQPYANALFEEQRALGRPLVLATTSPAPLVTPFAESLGFDGV